MNETLTQILTMLGVLSIPSIIWNFFLYRKNKKYEKWNAERNLKKLYAQKTAIESQFESNRKNLTVDYERNRYRDFDTDSERFNAWETEQGILQERKNDNLSRIDADIDYFEKISGQETSSVLFKETFGEKIKRKISELWQSIKQRN